MTLPILYSFRRCPYAMRARLAIDVSGQRCELREVVLRDKPAAMLEASPKGTVPVLVLADGQVLDESLDIMHWALAKSDPHRWLAPPAASPADMAELVALADSDFKHHLDRYKYASRYDVDPLVHRAGGAQFLHKLDGMLATAACLYGDAPALADMAIAPFVRQFAFADRDWFDAQDWPHLRAWLDRIVGSALFAGIMRKYPPWRDGDPVTRFPADVAA